MDDTVLIEKYKLGDSKVLPILVTRWHKIFCNKAYWVVKDADIAKDIAQDSWLTIINKIDHLENPERFKGWALRIVYTKSIDYIKKSNLERIRLNSLKYEEYVELLDKKEDNAIKKKLFEAIRSLPIEKQNVIRLFYVESYSLKEISEILNISVGTVKSRLFQAREKLKLILKNRNYEK